MTVVVSFVGPDGAVMASDSEATEGGGHTRYDVEKIWTCGALIMGYTGTTSVKQPLAQSLQQVVAQTFGVAIEVDREQAREILRQTAAQVLHSCYQFHVGNVDQFGVPLALNGILLVLGRDAEGYWMLEIDGMAQATFYTESGFHTVGSGAAAAYVSHSLMRAYDSVGRSVVDLKLIAHRTVQTCIDSIGGPLGVGGYVQLWASENNSPFAKASQQDIEIIEHGVEQWRKIERESLDQMRLGGAPEPKGAPFPDPPPSAAAETSGDHAGE
jgi:20S proteasome alpha/beta subunit